MKFEAFLKIYNQASLIDSSTFALYSHNPQDLRRKDSKGKDVTSGIYLYQIKSDKFVSTRKMIRVR